MMANRTSFVAELNRLRNVSVQRPDLGINRRVTLTARSRTHSRLAAGAPDERACGKPKSV